MSLTIENVAPYLGQPIYDIYGRKVGTLVSVYSDVDGTVTALELMMNDAVYETLPAERFEHTSEGLKVVPEWLATVKKVEKKLDVLRKRVKALEDLHKKGQVPEHAYKELRDKLSKEFEKAKGDSKHMKEVLRKRIYELENFVLHIEKAMTHLMVSYTAGELPEQGFKNSMDLLRYAKHTALEEKKDVEKHLSLLEKLEQEAIKAVSFEVESAVPTSSG
ncbi:MAG TPA: hypothetical protein ENF93_01730, partial [Ignisphaera sp.]|nr:hypothetical protein [Ignisphaera sp.]